MEQRHLPLRRCAKIHCNVVVLLDDMFGVQILADVNVECQLAREPNTVEAAG